MLLLCLPIPKVKLVRRGIFKPNSDENGLKDFESGDNIELAYGYRMSPNFALEGSIGKYKSEYGGSYLFRITFSNEGSVKATTSAMPITFTAKGILPLGDGKVEIYGGGGVGYYQTKVEWEDKGIWCTTVPYSFSDSKEENVSGFHIVGGIEFNVSDNVAFSGEAKWLSVKAEELYIPYGYEKRIKKLEEMGGVIFNVGVKYKF